MTNFDKFHKIANKMKECGIEHNKLKINHCMFGTYKFLFNILIAFYVGTFQHCRSVNYKISSLEF